VTADKKTSHIASCDSQTLMWAFPWAMSPVKKVKKSPGQDVAEMRQRAGWLLAQLQENEVELYIPSVVVAELLAGVHPSRHVKLSSEFSKRFFCPPFDGKASPLAARLWQFERGLADCSTGLPEAERSLRRILKADILIVASSKEHGVTDFYSHDANCRRLAKEAGMDSHDLPITSGRLFEEPVPEDEDSWE
jgi:predicted nucleic acid-binding protein